MRIAVLLVFQFILGGDTHTALATMQEAAVLALLAMYDMEGAEAIAKREGLPFDRELAFRQVEAMLGKKEADAMRYRYSPEAEEISYQYARKGIAEGMRLAAEDRARKEGKS